MKHNKKRITKIVDELVIYLFSVGGSDIHVNISKHDHYYKIAFESNYKKEHTDKIKRLVRYLNGPKQEEIEEYYWELTGEGDGSMDTEISLVAAMVDKSDINIMDDKIKIVLYRNI